MAAGKASGRGSPGTPPRQGPLLDVAQLAHELGYCSLPGTTKAELYIHSDLSTLMANGGTAKQVFSKRLSGSSNLEQRLVQFHLPSNKNITKTNTHIYIRNVNKLILQEIWLCISLSYTKVQFTKSLDILSWKGSLSPNS